MLLVSPTPTFAQLTPKFWRWFCKTNTIIYYFGTPCICVQACTSPSLTSPKCKNGNEENNYPIDGLNEEYDYYSEYVHYTDYNDYNDYSDYSNNSDYNDIYSDLYYYKKWGYNPHVWLNSKISIPINTAIIFIYSSLFLEWNIRSTLHVTILSIYKIISV